MTPPILPYEKYIKKMPVAALTGLVENYLFEILPEHAPDAAQTRALIAIIESQGDGAACADLLQTCRDYLKTCAPDPVLGEAQQIPGGKPTGPTPKG